ncbi:hypothetical protein BRADI_4g16286v3 [Brachypodium distachyon]|uniref:Uncharacterized protein n=1 Tax=Brachypodium distachyon TaxID=15368 RepID=A0A0Q3EPI3_BRADI|nr:hypothetical protein BRADI_4g16286v3 [Brachypodium distachyon]
MAITVTTYNKTRALRVSVCKEWHLPPEQDLGYTGTDLVLVLLDRKGDASLEFSAHFLFNYVNSLSDTNFLMQQTKNSADWQPLVQGVVKVNVDANFLATDNLATWGAGIRDHRGTFITSTWNHFTDCPSAEAPEAVACIEGVKLLFSFTNPQLPLKATAF